MFAIVRLRGEVNVRPEIKATLAMLHMHRVNHCIVVKEDPHYRGMIQKIKDYVAWGNDRRRYTGFAPREAGTAECEQAFDRAIPEGEHILFLLQGIGVCHNLWLNQPERTGNQAHLQVAPGSKGLKDHQEDRTTGWRSGIPPGSGGSYQEDEVEGNGQTKDKGEERA